MTSCRVKYTKNRLIQFKGETYVNLSLYDLVWFDGSFVPIEQATVPITTHTLHYGTSVFEGVRAYWNGSNLNLFRLDDHVKRFRRSGAYYDMSLNYTDEQIIQAIVGICQKNNVKESCYVRPFYFVGDHGISMHVTTDAPTKMAVFAFPFGDLFDKAGISVIISTWLKSSDASTPIQAKMGGNYLNSIISTGQAKSMGADEAILLDASDNVCEAPGENVFVVSGGELFTPPTSLVLDGITRNTVFEFAKHMNIKVTEKYIHKSEFMDSDEIFLAGTAAEIVPVTSVNSKLIGDGKPGPLTMTILKQYRETVMGNVPQYVDSWLTPVY